MAYDETKLATLGNVKEVAERTKQDYDSKINAVGGTVYSAAKADLSSSDESVIAAFFAAKDAPTPKKGDVFVVTTTVDGVNYEQAAYGYTGEAWLAMTGSVDAEKVILRENITLARWLYSGGQPDQEPERHGGVLYQGQERGRCPDRNLLQAASAHHYRTAFHRHLHPDRRWCS